LLALIRCLRPKQFVKNFLIFAPAMFAHGSRWILNPDVFLSLLATFSLFSLMAGSTYIINDYVDLERDRVNPSKKQRPMAAGQISPKLALAFSAIAIPSVLVVQFLFRNRAVAIGFLAYLVITLLYSYVLKHLVIIDVMTIATLFVLRAYIGCLDLDVPISMWFLSCVANLALFIATVKRHHELRLVKKGDVAEGEARAVIREYNEELVIMLMAVTTVGALLTYTFFSLNEAPANFGYSIPFVFYGLFRFHYLALVRGVGGTPEVTLLRDRPMLVAVFGWLVLLLVIYARVHHGGGAP
jgi:4-hydroxybenzoate polyprenyltransferase